MAERKFFMVYSLGKLRLFQIKTLCLLEKFNLKVDLYHICFV